MRPRWASATTRSTRRSHSSIDEDFKNPRATQFGAGVEREFAPGFSAGAEYVYVKTDNLQRNVDYNLPAPDRSSERPRRSGRSSAWKQRDARAAGAALGSVQVRESSASSEYNAAVFTARARKSWGQVSVNYVLSKSMSDDDNERDSGGQAAANAFDFGPEWGPARMDRRHQFNGFVLFYLPLDIDVSSSFRAYSGRPIDATLGTDTGVGNGDRINTDRPYSAPGVSFTRNASATRRSRTSTCARSGTWTSTAASACCSRSRRSTCSTGTTSS